MHILCIGLNHQTAGLSVREKLAFTEESLKAALSTFAVGEPQKWGLREAVILSTCNRVEFYAVSEHRSFAGVETFLSEALRIPVEEFSGHLYRCLDHEAIDHLFRVAAGLDSLILGEAQILGQVTQAFETALGKEAAGPILSRLFRAAIFTGKRTRSETGIGRNPASISSIAVRLAAQSLPDLGQARIAVLGAGEMAELAVEALRKRGADRIQVVNRTLEKAKQLARRWQGQACTFEAINRVLEQSDIVICSTGAPHALINTPTVRRAMEIRPNRPLVLIDIAVPRDVEPEVGELPGVKLFDMDALQAQLEGSLAGRRREIPRVELILEEEIAAFSRYLETLDVIPLIAEIHQQAESLRQAELEKTLRRMPHLNEEERKRIDALTHALVKKLLNRPLIHLRTQSGGPYGAHYVRLARDLFGLEESQ